MTYFTSPATVAVVAVVFTLGYVAYRAALPKAIPGIPHNKAATKSILGDAWAMLGHFHKHKTVFDWTSKQCANLNSPIVQLFIRPFSRPIVFLSDVREGQDIMLRRTKEFDRAKFFGDLFAGTIPHHSIRMETNDTFKKQRRLLNDTMSSKFLNEVAAPHVYRTVQDLMQLWREKTRLAKDHAFSVKKDIEHFSVDAMWAISFGQILGSLSSETANLATIDKLDIVGPGDEPVKYSDVALPKITEALITILDGLQPAATSPMPLLHHWVIRQFPKYRWAKKLKDDLIYARIQDAKNRLLQRDATEAHVESAADFLVFREQQAAVKDGRQPEFDSPAAQDEIFGFIVAGADTGSSLQAWFVKFLADNPRVQSKLRAILKSSFPDVDEPSVEAITGARIPYLDAVLEESLRQATVVPGQLRKAVVDTQVLGYHIPKGTDVFCMTNMYDVLEVAPWPAVDEGCRSASSRNTKDRLGVWDSSNIREFLPERWLKIDENGQEVFDPHAGPHTPFGLGIRACFGKKLGVLEFKMMATLLVWNFEFLECPATLSSYDAVYMMTNNPQQCYVRLNPLVSRSRRDSAMSTPVVGTAQRFPVFGRA